MIDLLSAIGAIASISAALYAWYQARKAKSFVKKVEEQIANQRRISELSRLIEMWDETYKTLGAFGPGAVIKNLRGQDTTSAAKKAQDYIISVMGCRTSLRSITDIEGRQTDLMYRLKRFSDAKSAEQIKQAGSALIAGLISLNSLIRDILDNDRERVIVT